MRLDSTRWAILGVAAALGLGSIAMHVAAQSGEKVVQVTARRFDYAPAAITLRKGVPVVLELTTQDVVMGFSAPDLGARADIVPGKVARVRLVPDKVGTFEFRCDIFCGSGHEEMTGKIMVTE
jgi:cytochrome c oxidase subunit 2